MKKKKISRGMHVFSVVMFMLRRRRRRKSINTGFWRRVVESVRKVHSEITIMPSSNFINTIVLPPAPHPLTESGEDDDNDDEDVDDSGDRISEAMEVFTAASSSSSSGGISGYGSAMNLRDLDYHYDENDDDVECYSDGEGGDDMIDKKAEEFIVKFYAQMKMQNQAYSQRCRDKRQKDHGKINHDDSN
ncbi:unnamed protein product [Microthlaspi erraticum]|uniref:Cotton fiber protein n=1 Tax=Microthlaspi erraticum TaxID=1685480 RepID=A0A6D2KH39_9BRAS|nr:unnamed protein product [Microthlaspi erraticum]